MVITTDSNYFKRAIRECYGQLCVHKFDNLDSMDPTSWKKQSAKTHPKINAVMCCLTMGIHPEKFIVKSFCQYWQTVSEVHTERQKLRIGNTMLNGNNKVWKLTKFKT